MGEVIGVDFEKKSSNVVYVDFGKKADNVLTFRTPEGYLDFLQEQLDPDDFADLTEYLERAYDDTLYASLDDDLKVMADRFFDLCEVVS